MKLTLEGIRKDKAAFEAAGYQLPSFDYEAVKEKTCKEPVWIHFGAGNIFRAFQANVVQTLLNQGILDTGLIAAEGYDYEIIEKSNRPHDNLSLLATLKADHTVEKTVVGSIMESLILDSENEAEYSRLKEIFTKPSLQMASFTITEKGYSLVNGKGELLPTVAADYEAGPEKPASYLGKVVSLLYTRYQNGALPIAMVSMDNCSHNGEKLRAGILTVAEQWRKREYVDEGFVAWVSDETRVSFPWSMIDKITPRPARVVEEALTAAGIEGMAPVVTAKNTYIAPFVNAEVPQYLVVEDRFPNGRPPLERAGVYLTDRQTVNDTERMKVTTCLNPLHTALAVYGCLLGYDSIAAEMRDPELKALVEHIGYDEGMPVVVDPRILNPRAFLQEVLEQRLPNPFIPDTPQRIATDTSQKVPIRFGETIKAYARRQDLEVTHLTFIPLAIAGWLRYLLGVDDQGRAMECSSDPMLDALQTQLAGVTLGDPASLGDRLGPVLSNPVLFGCDLTALGLGKRIEGMVREMLSGPGAVRETLKKYLKS